MNKTFALTALALACAAFAPAATASVDLIANGRVPGDATDLSGQSRLLENGVPANRFGGVGSGLAWAGGNTFLAVPDRGPNAVSWNADLDDTVSYVPRVHTLKMSLSPVPDGNLPYTLTVDLARTELLWSPTKLAYGPVRPAGVRPHHYPFSGRSDNFNPNRPSGAHADGRLDPEGIRVADNGRSVFVSDEYGPVIYQFDRATGARLRSLRLPANLDVAVKSPVGDTETADNTAGRVANKGMEGLAITPDGRTLVGFMQSALIQDGGDKARVNRLVTVDTVTGETHEYAYDSYLDDKGKSYHASELLALNSHEFLVLERDGKGLGDDSSASVKRLYKIDVAGATDVTDVSGEANLLPFAVPKSLFLDMRAAMNAAGIDDTQIPAKLEGAAFGQDLTVDGVVKHTLWIASDNDFLVQSPENALPTPSQWYVFTFTDADLGGSVFVPQAIRGR